MQETRYIETANEFFHDLGEAIRLVPDYSKVYNVYGRVFHRILDQQTADVEANLVGTFAKTDYLLKEHHAQRNLVHAVNATRARIRRRYESTPSELQEYYLHDLKNLSMFVAFLFDTPILQHLIDLFPQGQLTTFVPAVHSERMRIIVEKWDDDFIYGYAEDNPEGELVKVSYKQPTQGNLFGWDYIKELLSDGTQLNLVHVREDKGVLYPDLIIYEPDYLIDISSIAHCFASYAESPLVHLIARLQPSTSTEPTVLGNFAGQLLDEEIHVKSEECRVESEECRVESEECRVESEEFELPKDSRSYVQSATEFFRTNAMSLLAADVSAQFHSDASIQRLNIHKAISHDLPHDVSDFDPKEGITEPSFFSEMLGLQGRMDYLQLDFKILLEQKSGKGEFPFDNFLRPRFKEEHYVQMLLYMALIRYNYHEIYDHNNKELHAFLLYSKYKESLLGLGFAPELIYRAIKIRNTLAWRDLKYASSSDYRILDKLTPQVLNEKKIGGKLWDMYILPQLNDILKPIHNASPLEREYFYRFLTFIANEHVLSKLGNKTKENSGFASKWHDSLDEKLLAGNIYANLALLSPTDKTEGAISQCRLQFSEDEDNADGADGILSKNDMSNFRVGDIVILYPYDKGKEPDARQTMVFRSTIAEIHVDTITLNLRNPQSDARVFMHSKGKLWAIEHDFMESSYSSLYRGCHAFLCAPKARRDLLLFQREPEVDNSLELKGDYGAFNKMMIAVKRAQDFFLIIGPPGTGKTSFGMLNTLKEELLEPGSGVLLTSFTNRAVDEICSKLYKEDIDFIRVGSSYNCDPIYHEKLLDARISKCKNVNELRAVLRDARVIVGTTTSMTTFFQSAYQPDSEGAIPLPNNRGWMAIIDEASQILEPHLLPLLSAKVNGVPVIRKMVFIGDHKQLPAVVQQTPEVSRVNNKLLNDIQLTDCRLSLFERLLRRYGNSNEGTTQHPSPNTHHPLCYMLTKQGRMHRDIAHFPNIMFYEGKLQEVPLPHQHAETIVCPPLESGILKGLDIGRRITFIACKSAEHETSEKVNQAEADIIAELTLAIAEQEKDNFDPTETLGIIVPYRNQIATVRNTIERALQSKGISPVNESWAGLLTIDTVERYQGSQRKYIIYGFTVKKPYQLNFLTNNVFEDEKGNLIDRKLNVAMTRAEEHLIMVGNPELLQNNITFRQLINYLKERDCYFDLQK